MLNPPGLSGEPKHHKNKHRIQPKEAWNHQDSKPFLYQSIKASQRMPIYYLYFIIYHLINVFPQSW